MMKHLILLLTGLCACDGKLDLGLDDTGGDEGDRAAVATVSADYAVGALATVGEDEWDVRDSLASIAADPALVALSGELVVLGRSTEDTVRIYTPGTWSEPRLEFALEDGANPHDAALCGGALFVSQYGEDYVGVYDPDSGDLLGKVDLSEQADADGLPEAGSMVQRGDTLYLALEMLDEETSYWSPNTGKIVQIDCASQTLTAGWEVGPSPTITADPDSEDGLLVRTGVYFEDDGSFAWDGGLYAFDPASGTQSAIAPLESEVELNFTSIAAVEGGAALVVATDADWAYSTWCLDRASASLSLVDTYDTFLSSAQVNARGEAWIASRASWAAPEASGGLLVYDVSSCASKTGDSPITLSLEPYDIAFY